MPKLPENFIEYAQHHERVWGIDDYPQRPSLADMLNADIVVFWQLLGPENIQNKRFRVTLHDTLDEIEDYYTQITFSTEIDPPKERIHRIWRNQKRIRITDVKVQLTFSEDES
ncbi:MAG: hypothetical protein WBC91_24355 [Phototrophicaceae bacterium]